MLIYRSLRVVVPVYQGTRWESFISRSICCSIPMGEVGGSRIGRDRLAAKNQRKFFLYKWFWRMDSLKGKGY